jgi:hypothetical protein
VSIHVIEDEYEATIFALGTGNNPKNLVATNVTRNSITLTWTPPENFPNLTGYFIYRNGVEITLLNAQPTTFTDIDLSPGVLYNYTIRGVNSSNTKTLPSNISVRTFSLSAPPNLRATEISTNRIKLEWDQPQGNAPHHFLTHLKVGNDYVLKATTTERTSTIDGLASGQSHTFKVSSCDGQGNVYGFAEITVSTASMTDPQNVRVVSVFPNKIRIGWSAPASGTPAHYVIYRKMADGSLTSPQTRTQFQYTAESLPAGVVHTFVVKSVDTGGNESPGIELTVSTLGGSARTVLYEMNDDAWNKPATSVEDTGTPGGNGGTVSGGGVLFAYNGSGGTAIKFPSDAGTEACVTPQNQIHFGRRFVLEAKVHRGSEAEGDLILLEGTRADAPQDPIVWKVLQDGTVSFTIPVAGSPVVSSSSPILAAGTWTSLQAVVNLDKATVDEAVKLYKDGQAVACVHPTVADFPTASSAADTSAMAVKLLKRSGAFSLKSDFLRIKFQETFDDFGEEGFHDGEISGEISSNASASILIDPSKLLARVVNPPTDFVNGVPKQGVTIAEDTHPQPKSVFFGVFRIQFGLEVADFAGDLTVDVHIRKPEDVPSPDDGSGFKKIGEKKVSGSSRPNVGGGAWIQNYYWDSRQVQYDWLANDAQAYRTDQPVQFKLVVR